MFADQQSNFGMLVKVTEGTLRGEKLKNAHTSESFYSFKGIPYAKPPVGPLRFKNPEPPEKYDGVWDATKERSPCVYAKHRLTSVVGSEDCLYLNVYTPKLLNEVTSPMPVMFYFIPAGYSKGRKDFFVFGPDFLVAKNVILVIPNFRLHIFGFLNLGIDECPGNVGIKDKIAALKWTKKNIRQFGGDPNNITIFGSSSGANTGLNCLYSPVTRQKGLFHKAIIQSADFMQTGDILTVETCIERASRAAKNLGFESSDPYELHDFLMTIPAYELTSQSLGVLTQEETAAGENCPFVPSVEIAGPLDERVITAKGIQILKQDPGVPIMCGICNQEASINMCDGILAKRPATTFVQQAESLIIPRLFRNFTNFDESEKKVLEKFKKFYFQDKRTEEEIISSAIDLYSDVIYYKAFRDTVQTIVKHSSSPVYLYQFSYPAKIGRLQHILHYNRPSYLNGAGHLDDIGYLFRMALEKDKSPDGDETDQKMIEHMTTLWTNFATYGNPVQGLPIDLMPATPKDMSFLAINEELKVRSSFVFEERMKFIDSIYASLAPKKKIEEGM